MNKEIKKIIFILILYAFSGGVFYYFQEFWMAENSLSTKTISIILSLCSLITCSVIFLCSNIIKPNMLKKFAQLLLIFKSFLLLSLFLLYKSNYQFLIKFITMIEYATDTELLVLFYPLMSLVNKDNKNYALKDIFYEISYYLGALLVVLTIGKSLFMINLSHNSYLIISVIFSLLAGILVSTINIPYTKNQSSNNDILFTLIKKIKKDNISKYYLAYVFFARLALYIVFGIFLTILVQKLGFTELGASYLKLGLGICGSLLASFILFKLTLKNNYVNIAIKFLGRVVLYLITVIFFCKELVLISFIYTLLSFPCYSHITEAPYINRFKKEEQFAFANLSDIIGYFGRSLGTFLCGLIVFLNIRLNFVISALFFTIAVCLLYKALSLYNKEVKE